MLQQLVAAFDGRHDGGDFTCTRPGTGALSIG